jgi:hypothetical protein
MSIPGPNGTIVIRQNIAHEFKTYVRLDYTEQGLVYEFEVDLRMIKRDDLSSVANAR